MIIIISDDYNDKNNHDNDKFIVLVTISFLSKVTTHNTKTATLSVQQIRLKFLTLANREFFYHFRKFTP